MALNKLQLSELLATYGSLLTDKQKSIVAMYCDLDCTLTEIADEHGISRQGVRDTVLKAEKTLLEFEQKLCLSQFKRDVSLFLSNNQSDKVIDLTKKFVEKE